MEQAKGHNNQKSVGPLKKKLGSAQRKRRWRRLQREAAVKVEPEAMSIPSPNKETPTVLEDIPRLGNLSADKTLKEVNFLLMKNESQKSKGNPLADKPVNQQNHVQQSEESSKTMQAWLESLPSPSKKTWSTRTFFQLAYPR